MKYVNGKISDYPVKQMRLQTDQARCFENVYNRVIDCLNSTEFDRKDNLARAKELFMSYLCELKDKDKRFLFYFKLRKSMEEIKSAEKLVKFMSEYNNYGSDIDKKPLFVKDSLFFISDDLKKMNL